MVGCLVLFERETTRQQTSRARDRNEKMKKLSSKGMRYVTYTTRMGRAANNCTSRWTHGVFSGFRWEGAVSGSYRWVRSENSSDFAMGRGPMANRAVFTDLTHLCRPQQSWSSPASSRRDRRARKDVL